MPEKKSFERSFLDGALPKIYQSHIGMHWLSRDIGDIDELDVQQAVQLGAMLLLNKPLVLVAEPGTTIPPRLARVADLILHIDPDNPADLRRLGRALQDFSMELDRAESEHHRQPGG